MDANIINPFVASTVNVIKTMAFTEPVSGAPRVKMDRLTWGDVTGIIGLAGEGMAGNMVLSFSAPSILGIVSKMLGEQFTELNKDVVDAVGELTNMISGGAKAELYEYGYRFHMATPMIIVGKNVELSQLSKVPIIQIPFTTPEGEFVCEANLANRS